MAFTVEDGSIVSGANSYLSVADADTYHSDRGNADWAAATTGAKQSALIRATDYIEQKYSERFKGDYASDDQELSWPRYGLCEVESDVIPKELKNAVAILALEALSDDLNPTLDRGGAIKREKVDVLETEYFDWAPGATVRPAIDGLLRKYMTGSSMCVPVVRV